MWMSCLQLNLKGGFWKSTQILKNLKDKQPYGNIQQDCILKQILLIIFNTKLLSKYQTQKENHCDENLNINFVILN